jgi:hypothetical protein
MVRDFFVGEATCDEFENLRFALGQFSVGTLGTAGRSERHLKNATGNCRVDIETANGNRSDGLNQRFSRRSLEHVPSGTCFQGLPNEASILVRCQNQDADCRRFICEAAGQGNAIDARQGNVSDHDVGLRFENEGQRRSAIGRFPEQFEVVFVHNEVSKSVEDNWLLVRKNDARPSAHGDASFCPTRVLAEVQAA